MEGKDYRVLNMVFSFATGFIDRGTCVTERAPMKIAYIVFEFDTLFERVLKRWGQSLHLFNRVW